MVGVLCVSAPPLAVILSRQVGEAGANVTPGVKVTRRFANKTVNIHHFY